MLSFGLLHRLSAFYYVESIYQQKIKLTLPILSIRHGDFMAPVQCLTKADKSTLLKLFTRLLIDL